MKLRPTLAGVPVAVALWVLIASIALLGLRNSVRIAYWFADRLPAPRRSPLGPAAIAEAQALTIARVGDHMLPAPRCLPRALLLAAALRRRGIVAELCIGAQLGDVPAFEAHAWVELAGRPLRQDADVKTRFRCLYRLPTLSQ